MAISGISRSVFRSLFAVFVLLCTILVIWNPGKFQKLLKVNRICNDNSKSCAYRLILNIQAQGYIYIYILVCFVTPRL